MKQEPIYDCIVVGAGAAGLMTAIQCANHSVNVVLLDSKNKIGAKILMSGGNRCNVTHVVVTEKDYGTSHPRFVRNVLKNYSQEKTKDFFQDIGVNLVVEDTGKLFPSTHSARTVLNALVQECSKKKIPIKNNHKVNSLCFLNNLFLVKGEGFSLYAKTVVLSTGGLSHPTTGSDGSGYQLAQSFGHNLVETSPALTPLNLKDSDWNSLSGISFTCELTLWVDGKKKKSFKDGFLFTHTGLSGPTVLNISRDWERLRKIGKVKILANFLPDHNSEEWKQRLEKAILKFPKKNVRRFLSEIFPERFVDVLLKKISLEKNKILNQLSKQNKNNLIQGLFAYEFRPEGVVGYSKAEVTAGGVCLDEVNAKLLESFRQEGLFFSGEILDVDGRIGGFNFQWAWSSGYLVAQGVRNRLKSKGVE